jgi:hypothetical protein
MTEKKQSSTLPVKTLKKLEKKRQELSQQLKKNLLRRKASSKKC